MAGSKKRPTHSLYAFIEQMALALRNSVKKPQSKKRAYAKEDGLSNVNKIGQIASLLRSEVKKRKNRKKS